jgi:shikimate dehydrogenase
MQASRLVGTFGARTADELGGILESDAAALLCDLVELRLDLLADGADAVERLVGASPRPVIATFRPRRGDERPEDEARMEVLARAVEAGAEWIDVESHVPAHLVPTGAKVLRSLHLNRLPRDADGVVEELLAVGDAAKLVARAGNAADALRALTLVHRNAGRLVCHVVSQPFTRFGGALLGATVTYAALRPGGTIGLQIPTVTAALRKWRYRRLVPGARAFLLLGAGVDGSVSPAMLNCAFEDLGAPIVSLPWSCDDVAPGLAAIERFGWAGAAVTIPHKGRARDLVVAWDGSIAESAAEVGAVNTVLFDEGRLAAHNTDLPGLLDALWPHLPPEGVQDRPAVVLGAGGAARAAVRALQRIGMQPLIHARRPEAAQELAGEVGVGSAGDEAAVVAADPAVVVDATPAGPPGGVPLVDASRLPGGCVVVDMLVAGRPTALVAAARAAGLRAVEGADMLLHQAAHQVRLLTGESPDRGRMAESGWAALRARDRHIVLLGLRCTGKSRVGELLGQSLGRPHLDTDVEIHLRLGRSPEELIRAGDEAEFRAAESALLGELSAHAPAVFATGGGAALHGDTLRSLCGDSFVVLLDAPDAVLLERLAAQPRAPLTDLEPADELRRQREDRMPLYEQLADARFDTSSEDPRATAEGVLAALDLAGIGTGAAPEPG